MLKTWLDFVSSLSWPVVVVLALLLFKESLGELVGRLTKASAGPVSAEFGSKVDSLRQKVDEVADVIEVPGEGDEPRAVDPTSSTAQDPESSSDNAPRVGPIDSRKRNRSREGGSVRRSRPEPQSAERPGNGAPTLAWASVLVRAREVVKADPVSALVLGRVALETAFEAYDIPQTGGLTRKPMSRAQKLAPVLGTDWANAAFSAIRLANEAVHGRIEGVTVASASEYLDQVERLIIAFENAMQASRESGRNASRTETGQKRADNNTTRGDGGNSDSPRQ